MLLYSDDLDATVDAVRAAGGTVVQDPYAFPGGRRFHFTDPSGTELGVWASVVNRLGGGAARSGRPSDQPSAMTTAAAIPASCDIEIRQSVTPIAAAAAATVALTSSTRSTGVLGHHLAVVPVHPGRHAECLGRGLLHREPGGERRGSARSARTR